MLANGFALIASGPFASQILLGTVTIGAVVIDRFTSRRADGMSATPPASEIRGLRKRYGDTVALDGLDLDARPGEILGVAGPNGAGKSTMVKILAGEVDWDEGEIVVDGEPWSSEFGSHRVAVVHQEPQLFPNLTVGENIVVGHEENGWRWPKTGDEHHRLFEELGILRRCATRRSASSASRSSSARRSRARSCTTRA